MKVGDRGAFERGSVINDSPFAEFDVSGTGVIETVWKHGDVWYEVRDTQSRLIMVWPEHFQPADTPAETKTRP